ncbi:unnamed protein product [Pseudo-nitzschia multistriata]|nr:unnamed protein product [Pseudo-nitzschia multistriata]
MEGVPLPPGIPGLGGSTDPLEAVLGPFPCARLRNLPFDATLEDILILFQGLVVIDVVLIGQGEAFVIFANPMDYQMALQRDRQTIGRSFVAITPGSRSDYYSAIATVSVFLAVYLLNHFSFTPHSLFSFLYLTYICNLDFLSSFIILWLQQQWQETQGGPIVRTSDDIHLGEEHHHHHKDTKGTELFGMIPSGYPSQSSLGGHGGGRSDSGSRRGGGGGSIGGGSMSGRSNTGRMNPPGVIVKRTGGGIQIGEHTGFLRMRGLPFSATKEDIYVFFEEYNTVSDSIVLTYRSDGRATGEAYVQFETGEDSKRAMDLHRKMMGNRYIELFLSNKEEHGRALARFGDR